ncbi:MAG: glycosyltransferase, partial [Dehalococcoidia bacterium]|nr:glycosyltransferase [Dehalococcoidia bacterium]
MLYQQVVFLLLAVLLGNLILNLKYLPRAKGGRALPNPPPLISILIPARNEETNIRACLESLQKQDYPNCEFLVLDDSSTDRTGEIVAELAAEDSRIRLYKGLPLPPDWAGKPFACHQLAREARGSWLLFTDADTVHAPNMLSHVLSTALQSGAALVSGFPYQKTTSVWQRMALPVLFYFLLLAWMPFWFLQRSRWNVPSVAIGQFLFFSAQEYHSIGGHEAVKSRVLEDVWLGFEMAKHRYRQLTLDLSKHVSCQMYREFGSMWDGIARWLYMVASVSAVLFLGIMAVASLLLLAPFLFLLYGLF